MAWFVSRRNCPSFLTANTVAGPLDRPHRSGRATGNHQDHAAALLLHRRTAHPHRTPPHPASSPALALGNPVHSRLGPIARHSPTSLTARRRRPTRPPDSPRGCPANSCQPSPPVPLPACRLAVFAGRRHCGPPPGHWRGHRPLPSTPSIGTGPGPFASPYPSSPVSTPPPYPFGGFGLMRRDGTVCGPIGGHNLG